MCPVNATCFRRASLAATRAGPQLLRDCRIPKPPQCKDSPPRRGTPCFTSHSPSFMQMRLPVRVFLQIFSHVASTAKCVRPVARSPMTRCADIDAGASHVRFFPVASMTSADWSTVYAPFAAEVSGCFLEAARAYFQARISTGRFRAMVKKPA